MIHNTKEQHPVTHNMNTTDDAKAVAVAVADDEEGDYVYGAQQIFSFELNMAGGGADWWNYIVECNNDGKQQTLYLVNSEGRTTLVGLLYYNDKNPDRVQVLREPKDGWTEFDMDGFSEFCTDRE